MIKVAEKVFVTGLEDAHVEDGVYWFGPVHELDSSIPIIFIKDLKILKNGDKKYDSKIILWNKFTPNDYIAIYKDCINKRYHYLAFKSQEILDKFLSEYSGYNDEEE